VKTDNGNREQWLQQAVAKCIGPMFESHGYEVPEVRVSCGFPSRSATSAKKRRIGECWTPEAAGDKRAQIFITPLLDDHQTVLATLVHEVVHAVDENKNGHGGPFKKIATKVGLVGKMTATTAGEELQQRIEGWVKKLGAYPHAKLSAMVRVKQTTRMIKCECEDCGYTVRSTKKWIEDMGAPLCPCNSNAMEVK
jgi:hypothetical protein